MKAGVATLAAALAWLPGAGAGAAPPEPPARPACAAVSCSASGIAPDLLKERAQLPARSVQRGSGSSGALPLDPWKYRLGGGAEPEDAQCLLEFGIGTSLDRKGVLTTHALGQRRDWPKE